MLSESLKRDLEACGPHANRSLLIIQINLCVSKDVQARGWLDNLGRPLETKWESIKALQREAFQYRTDLLKRIISEKTQEITNVTPCPVNTR